jgi:hypothetical protein
VPGGEDVGVRRRFPATGGAVSGEADSDVRVHRRRSIRWEPQHKPGIRGRRYVHDYWRGGACEHPAIISFIGKNKMRRCESARGAILKERDTLAEPLDYGRDE